MVRIAGRQVECLKELEKAVELQFERM